MTKKGLKLVKAAYKSLDGQAMRMGVADKYVVKFSPDDMLWVYIEPERLAGQVVVTGLTENVWKPHMESLLETLKPKEIEK